VLRVATFEISDPVAELVLMEADDPAVQLTALLVRIAAGGASCAGSGSLPRDISEMNDF
jgi:hypothetical protein